MFAEAALHLETAAIRDVTLRDKMLLHPSAQGQGLGGTARFLTLLAKEGMVDPKPTGALVRGLAVDKPHALVDIAHAIFDASEDLT